MKIKFLKLLFPLILLLLADSTGLKAYSTIKLDQDKPRKDSVIRILAIGNSFSEDAIEYYLHGLAKAGGYKVIIGNLYIGGAPLDLHWKNASGDSAVYNYRKIDLDGVKKRTAKTSIARALADENWSYISFQQASPESGIYESFLQPLPMLFDYVKQKATNPTVKYIWHQTWAYAQNSKHNGFANYNKDQMRMYEAIAQASKKVKDLVAIDIVVPAGTAIQNGRTKLGDVMCRDGYHLEENIGRYTAACAWYEQIFRQNVIGNMYKPEKVNGADALTAQKAGHRAVKKPFKVSRIK
jgi:hypothetical protein